MLLQRPNCNQKGEHQSKTLRLSFLYAKDQVYGLLLQSYLDAEGPPHAPFTLPECGGMMLQVICLTAPSFLQDWLLARPPVLAVCVSVLCLIPSGHVCCPAWTPCPAPVWHFPSMPLFWTVIISLRVTQDQGPGQNQFQTFKITLHYSESNVDKKKTKCVYFSLWNYITRLTWVCREGLMLMKPNFMCLELPVQL